VDGSTLAFMNDVVPSLYVLQLKSQSVETKEESCIRINIRELNKVSSTTCLSYILGYLFILH